MDDLISRSALLDEIESLSVHITGLRSGKGVLADCMKEYKKSVLRIIDEQPTAYDEEKVVKKLKQDTPYITKNGVEFITVGDAVCTVRKGGVE